MKNKENIYQAFGELIYAVAMADGAIQQEEIDKLNAILSKHTSGDQIKWSFDYEKKKHTSLKTAFDKALITLGEYGPFEEYGFLFDTLEEVAEAFDGIVKEERDLIDNFKKELHSQFQEDNRFEGY